MFVSVTRVRIRSVRYLPAFLWWNLLTNRQVTHAPGFRGGRLLADAHRTFWTLTVWETEQHMRAFRGSGPHVRVMPRLLNWCDEGSFAHWITMDVAVPLWPEAYAHLVSDGRVSRVANPSPEHQARQFAEPRLRPLIGTDLHPAQKP
jgi:hypothetical protein